MEDDDPDRGKLVRRLSASWIPTVALGALVTLVSWTPLFDYPTVGVDPSWGGGLYMAAEQGLAFGTEVVFTFGPLGFLGLDSVPIWFADLAALAFVFQALLYAVLCISLVFSLRGSIGLVGGALAAFAALVLAGAAEGALVIVLIWTLVVLRTPEDRPRYAVEGLIVGGATLAALECLMKLSVGPVILIACLLALIGARARPWQLAAFAGLFALELGALWLLSGQGLGELGDYISGSRQIISGYGEAMGVVGLPAWQGIAAGAATVLLALAAFLTHPREGHRRLFAAAIALLIGFSAFKQGLVRFDADHIEIFFATALLLWLALPWRGVGRLALATGALALALVTYDVSVTADFRPNPVENVDDAIVDARTLLAPAQRETMSEGARATMQDVYLLDDEIRALVGERPVAIEPWEIGVAWAYDLNWSPLPVFQNYAAYTSELDALNAATVDSAEGPELILRHQLAGDPGQFDTRAIDGRYPGWDPPAQSLAVLCNFEELRKTDRWQLLERVADRCGRPELIESTGAGEGEPVEVPGASPGEVVFARVDGAGVGGLERLRALLLRAEPRFAVVDDESFFRIVPGTAGDGLLLRGDPSLTGSGQFEQAPQAETIALLGAGDDLRYEFFRMSVDDGPP